MPTYPPRDTTIKKEEELLKRQFELAYAFEKGHDETKINKAVEKYRLAKLSLFKAQAHIIREKEFQKKPCTLKLEKVVSETAKWKSLPVEDIIKILTINK